MQSFDFDSALVGKTVEFEYPAANYPGIPARWERRRVRVDRIRNVAAEPLDAVTLELNPTLSRCGLLVTGHDFGRQAERSFYTGSMRGVRVIREPEVFTLAQVIEEGVELVLQPAMEPARASQYVAGFNGMADVTGRRCRSHAFTLASLASDQLCES